jgi:hypothetical protein
MIEHDSVRRTVEPAGPQTMKNAGLRQGLFAAAAILMLLPAGHGLAEAPKAPAAASAAASEMADFFSEFGDKIYEECIFELSQEQIEVRQALIQAYVKLGASSADARRLAVQQIQLPKLSDKCEQIRSQQPQKQPLAPSWTTTTSVAKKPAPIQVLPKIRPEPVAPIISLAGKKMLPQWDCAPGVDFVSIQHKGHERKLTDGDICNPFEDVVRAVPDSVQGFRLGYTITTGRLFIISTDPQAAGRTIAWAISGREVCRNNPDPDCLAARSIGPLPPGEYSFAAEKDKRVSWGPQSKRMVAGIYLRKLWHKDRYNRAQTAAILARGNIAIHVRLKGEMSEACLGLGPKGWAYVATLIQQGRATGVDVHIDEPHPQIAEKAPIIRASTFSLSSLFK